MDGFSDRGSIPLASTIMKTPLNSESKGWNQWCFCFLLQYFCGFLLFVLKAEKDGLVVSRVMRKFDLGSGRNLSQGAG